MVLQGFHRVLKFLGRDAGVDGGCRDVPVTETLLNQSEVADALEQSG